MVYADVNISGGSVHTIKKNAEALVAASQENGLEVKVYKAKYKVMSRDQDAGQSHSIKNDNSSFERVEEFKYLGTSLTNQNSTQEEIKNRLNSGNACYHSVQNLLSYSLQSKNLKINPLPALMYQTVLDLNAACRSKRTEAYWLFSS